MKYILTLIAIIAAALFINTAPPTIYLGDSGEIVSAAYTLGIAHPPGYPLYMLLGKLASLAPLGDMAFRMNILPAALALAAFLLFYLCNRAFLEVVFKGAPGSPVKKFSALLPAAIYLFSSMFWFEAIHAKGGIYIFMHVVVLLALYFTLMNFLTGKTKYFYAAVYAAGLLIPAHNSTAVFLCFTLAALAINNYRKITFKSAATALVLFALALVTPYMYLFIRVGAQPEVNFQFLKDAGDVMGHIFRKSYERPLNGVFSISALFFRAGNYFTRYLGNYNLVAAFLGYGLYVIYSRSKKLFSLSVSFLIINLAALLLAINNSSGFAMNSISGISLYSSRNFYLVSDIIPLIISAAGFYSLMELITGKYRVNGGFVFSIFALVPLIMITVNYDINNHSRKFLGLDYAVNIMKTLKPGDSIFINNDCPLFNILYLKTVKKEYLDIKAYDRGAALLDNSIYPGPKDDVSPETAGRAELKIALENPGKVYYSGIRDFAGNTLVTKPYGVIYKLVDAGMDTSWAAPLSGLYTQRDYFNNTNLDFYYSSFAARYLVMKGRDRAITGDREGAERFIKAANSLAPASTENLTAIAMVYYYYMKDINTAIDYINRIVELDPYDMDSVRLLATLFAQINPMRALPWLNTLYNGTGDETQKAEIKLQIGQINDLYKKTR